MKPSKGSWNGEFGGVVYVLDGFPQRDLCCGFLYAQLISFYFTATTPRATTPHLYITGYHAEGYHAPSIPHGLPRLYHHCTAITTAYISRLPRQGLPLPIFTTTCYHTRQSRSYFIVYLSPALTPPVLLTYTTTGRHTLQPPPHRDKSAR